MDEITVLQQSFLSDLKKIKSSEDLNSLEMLYFGRQGKINKLLQNLKNLPIEEKKEFGRKINQAKTELESALKEEKQKIISLENNTSWVDVTLPGQKKERGSLHPFTYAIEEITEIFKRIGFIQMSYPEVEWEYFAFDALNMPVLHPARDDFESVYIDSPKKPKYGGLVLSPHTSSGQVREMLRVQKPPIRMLNIAKCYRRNWDATHTPMFHQFEGLCIDTNINITNLKGTLNYFAKEFFGKDREARIRPHHFQFTEPSFEVDITCGICLGTGYLPDKKTKCRVCKSGWLELGGSGMVHPNVLKEGGIDPDKYQGFAFGWGIERCIMMRPEIGLSEMRLLYNGDIRFLEQF